MSSRDSARTPMQWSGKKNAGFSTVKPWFTVNPNYRKVNVEREEKDPESILNFYRQLLALRKNNDTLLWGRYREYYPKSRRIYMYERRYRGERILVVCSFADRDIRYRLPKGYAADRLEELLCNYPAEGKTGRLRPYEVQVFRCPPQ